MEMEDNPIWSIYLVSYFWIKSFDYVSIQTFWIQMLGGINSPTGRPLLDRIIGSLWIIFKLVGLFLTIFACRNAVIFGKNDKMDKTCL